MPSCGFAIKLNGNRVSRHLHEQYNTMKLDRRELSLFMYSLRLRNSADIPARPDGSAPHPQLVLQPGFAYHHYDFRSSNLEVMARHFTRRHAIPRLVSQGSNKSTWLNRHGIDQGLETGRVSRFGKHIDLEMGPVSRLRNRGGIYRL